MLDSIGFIGAGRVAHVMLGGWRHTDTRLPAVRVYDESPDAVALLQAKFPQVLAATLAEASASGLVFAGLHPPVLAGVLPAIAPYLRSDGIFCSLAPVIRLSALQEKLGGFSRLARLNPNAPSIIGCGYNPISFGAGLPQNAREELLALLEPLGSYPIVDDELIETYAVISAMGPTYFWFQFEELRRMAESFGLSAEASREAVSRMLHGAVDTLLASELEAVQVMDLIPVRPMASEEGAIRDMMQAHIGAIHARLHA